MDNTELGLRSYSNTNLVWDYLPPHPPPVPAKLLLSYSLSISSGPQRKALALEVCHHSPKQGAAKEKQHHEAMKVTLKRQKNS